MSAFYFGELSMLRKAIQASRNYAKALMSGDPHAYMKRVKGVVHIGASSGQERDIYHAHDLDVLWIEPIPEIFLTLVNNIKPYPKQVAINSLILDKDNPETILHISSNNGMSSSVLDLKKHVDIWPEVHYVANLLIPSKTLVTAYSEHNIDASAYDCLVLDTQGSELLALKGANSLLNNFRYIKTEAADFESYSGCATVDEIVVFLAKRSFSLVRKDLFARHNDGGAYYDLLFRSMRLD
jgi:FkbM family methyltransferase